MAKYEDHKDEWSEFEEWLEDFFRRYNYKKVPHIRTMHRKLRDMNPSYVEADCFDITFNNWLLSFVNTRLEQLNSNMVSYLILKDNLDSSKNGIDE